MFGHWHFPRLRPAVFLRNLLVWRKLAISSLVGNIAEPLMWLVVVLAVSEWLPLTNAVGGF